MTCERDVRSKNCLRATRSYFFLFLNMSQPHTRRALVADCNIPSEFMGPGIPIDLLVILYVISRIEND